MKIDIKQCVFKMLGGGTGEELEFKVGEGTLQWTEHKAREYVKNRGVLDTVRNADEEPVDVSFEFTWEWLRNAVSTGYESPYYIITTVGTTKTGAWDSSDDDDPCAPPSIDLEITHSVPCNGTTKTEVITIPKFRYEQIQCDPKAGNIQVSGKANIVSVVDYISAS